MALTKKMLLAMEISEEKADQIIEAHTDSLKALREERDGLKAKVDESKDAAQKLEQMKKDLVKAQAKADDADEMRTKYDDLKKQYDDFKTDVSNKETTAKKEKAYRKALKAAGISEKRHDAIIKVTDLSKVELDDNGDVKDEKAVVTGIQTEWADFVVTEDVKGADTPAPPSNNGGSTFEKMSLAEKMTYANENPTSPEVVAWLK